MKSIILYVFAFVVAVFVCSIDSLSANAWFWFLMVIGALGYFIYRNYSEADYFKYSGYNFICEKLGWDANED